MEGCDHPVLAGRQAGKATHSVNDSIVDVILLDVPVALWAKSREHRERMLAELAGGPGDVPARVIAALAHARDEYPTITETADAELSTASRRHDATVDVAYPVPLRAREELLALVAALDEADDHARTVGREDLVTPDDLVAFRRWYFGEIERQLDGGFPSAWPG
jgi:hypothetical protein